MNQPPGNQIPPQQGWGQPQGQQQQPQGQQQQPQGQQQQPMGQYPPQQGFGANPYPPEDVEPGKMLALLGYLIGFIWIVPLIQRDNAFAMYHAKQAMTYTLIMMVVGTLGGIIGAFTCGIGALVIFPLFYPWIMGIVYASQGTYAPMPWIGQYAEQWFSGFVADKRPMR